MNNVRWKKQCESKERCEQQSKWDLCRWLECSPYCPMAEAQSLPLMSEPGKACALRVFWWESTGREWHARATCGTSSNLPPSFPPFDKYVSSTHYSWNCTKSPEYEYEHDRVLALWGAKPPPQETDIERTDSNQPLISCSELYLTKCFHFPCTLYSNHLQKYHLWWEMESQWGSSDSLWAKTSKFFGNKTGVLQFPNL